MFALTLIDDKTLWKYSFALSKVLLLCGKTASNCYEKVIFWFQ